MCCKLLFCFLAVAMAQEAMELANGFLVQDKPLVICYGQGKRVISWLDAREQNQHDNWKMIWFPVYFLRVVHGIQTTYTAYNSILTSFRFERKVHYFTITVAKGHFSLTFNVSPMFFVRYFLDWLFSMQISALQMVLVGHHTTKLTENGHSTKGSQVIHIFWDLLPTQTFGHVE